MSTYGRISHGCPEAWAGVEVIGDNILKFTLMPNHAHLNLLLALARTLQPITEPR